MGILELEYRKQRHLGELVGEFTPKDLMDYIRINAYAALDEIHEAVRETGWKPWATSNHFNRDKYLEELADAQLFLDNLKLAALKEPTSESVAELTKEFQNLVLDKIDQAVERHEDGYTGLKTGLTND